jgi:hypothetical protein
VINYFSFLSNPSLSEDVCFDISSASSIDSENYSQEDIQSKHLTEFPRFESSSMPRPVIRRLSTQDASYAIARKGSIASPNAIPIQYYRFGIYAGIESAITQHKITRYTLRIVQVKLGAPSIESSSLKRYSQIRKLYSKLVQQYPLEMQDSPTFPRKEIFGRWNDEIIRTRVVELDHVFKFLVLHPTLVYSELVQQFFKG